MPFGVVDGDNTLESAERGLYGPADKPFCDFRSVDSTGADKPFGNLEAVDSMGAFLTRFFMRWERHSRKRACPESV